MGPRSLEGLIRGKESFWVCGVHQRVLRLAAGLGVTRGSDLGLRGLGFSRISGLLGLGFLRVQGLGFFGFRVFRV